MKDNNSIEGLQYQAETLEESFRGATRVASGFGDELRRIQTGMAMTNKDMAALERSLSSSLKKAFESVIVDGKNLSDALKMVGRSMVDTIYSSAMKPVKNQLNEVVSQGVSTMLQNISPFEKGGRFSQGRVIPFAKGGVVSNPLSFPMRGATGLMGEAGPEAIMPLTRGADGSLGVRMQGGGQPSNIVINISTPDVEGFRRSQSQIAAQLGRALSRGQRNR